MHFFFFLFILIIKGGGGFGALRSVSQGIRRMHGKFFGKWRRKDWLHREKENLFWKCCIIHDFKLKFKKLSTTIIFAEGWPSPNTSLVEGFLLKPALDAANHPVVAVYWMRGSSNNYLINTTHTTTREGLSGPEEQTHH